MIFFCAGQMRIQTFIAIAVPNMAPRWMNTARGQRTCSVPARNATTTVLTMTPICSLPLKAFSHSWS